MIEQLKGNNYLKRTTKLLIKGENMKILKHSIILIFAIVILFLFLISFNISFFYSCVTSSNDSIIISGYLASLFIPIISCLMFIIGFECCNLNTNLTEGEEIEKKKNGNEKHKR